MGDTRSGKDTTVWAVVLFPAACSRRSCARSMDTGFSRNSGRFRCSTFTA